MLTNDSIQIHNDQTLLRSDSLQIVTYRTEQQGLYTQINQLQQTNTQLQSKLTTARKTKWWFTAIGLAIGTYVGVKYL